MQRVRSDLSNPGTDEDPGLLNAGDDAVLLQRKVVSLAILCRYDAFCMWQIHDYEKALKKERYER